MVKAGQPSESTLKSYRLSYAQFEKFLEKEKVKKVTVDTMAKFVKALATGFPNDRPKKPSAIGIKYKGVTFCLNEAGHEIPFERNFVNKTLGIVKAKAPETDEMSDEAEAPAKTPKVVKLPVSAKVRAPKN